MPALDRAARRALAAATRDHPPGAPVPELSDYVRRNGVAGIGSAARRHGVVGCLWTALLADGLADAPGTAEIRAAYHTGVGRHLRMLTEVEFVDRVLTDAGLGYLLLKGPVLAEAVYRRPDLRTYLDLDLLVRPVDFPAALARLQEAGCEVYERNWQLAVDHLIGELRLFTPAGTVLDLHWDLCAGRSVRDAFAIDQAAVRRRARRVSVGGRLVPAMDPADLVVHLALHASFSGGDRLVWLKDLEQALTCPDAPGWDALVERAASWPAALPVALMLARTRAVLGLPVPTDVLRRLSPDRAWRAVTRLADRISPQPGEPGRGSVARLVAGAVRVDGARSRRTLIQHSGAWLRSGAGRPGPDERVRRLLDPVDPDAAAHPAGGAAARSAYLDLVASMPG